MIKSNINNTSINNTSGHYQTTSHSDSQVQVVRLIYAGGTFGSYGKPLSTLDSATFLPLLLERIHQHITPDVSVLDNCCVKDSSQLTPHDFVYFFELILSNYSARQRRFVLITGTDTLSYLGAFLAEAFAGTDICIVLTASMRPLFDADVIYDYVIDQSSDAWGNLKDAIGLAGYGDAGVSIAFAGESWAAQTVQKIHSHDLMAFTGHSRAGYPANSYVKSLPDKQRQHWITDKLSKLEDIKQRVEHITIPTLYCVPNSPDWLATQFTSLKRLPPSGVLLIGFGAGNLPHSDDVATLLDELYLQGHILVCATQCPYGGVSDAYEAGSWQYEHHVLSGGRLTISALYARLLWLHLAYDSPARRRQRWTYTVKQTNISR